MRTGCFRMILSRASAAVLLAVLGAAGVRADDGVAGWIPPDPSKPAGVEPLELRAVTDAVRDLQAQVQALSQQLSELRAGEQRALAEARELSRQLELTRAQLHLSSQGSPSYAGAVPETHNASLASAQYPPAGTPGAPAAQDLNERVARLEENQQFLDDKLSEQYQSKVESGSKYRLRLSGLVLMNLFINRGNVENLDVPQLATEQGLLDSRGTFGGTVRQSQIGLQVFGPDVVGAHTSADLRFDFAGGFPEAQNGVMMGLVRLRTGTVRLDWKNTSIVAGQDSLFFSPLTPTSLATLAVPALAYAGNLWSWTPQVRVEHRIPVSDSSSFLIQGGILDSWTGDVPPKQFYRYATWGEESAQPAYAARVAWNCQLAGQPFALGFGGVYGRQYWGLGRGVDGWVGTTDLTLPLGKLFTLTGEFYRGRAVAGWGGAIGQDVVVPGPFTSSTTPIQGLDSIGGWAQLKYKPAPKFEVNGAFGQDNPYADELRRTLATPPNYDSPLARNQSALVNFIYQPRSAMVLSVEYRHVRTFEIGGDSYRSNHVNLAVGYIF
jgi:hypothetical protein